MKTFFPSFFGALLGVMIGLLVMGLILIAIVSSAISGQQEKLTTIDDGSVLHVSFGFPIVERGNENTPPVDLGPFGAQGGAGLDFVVEDIAKAAGDDRVEGMFLDISSVSASPASLFTVRESIEAFKDSGKWVIAFSEGYAQGAYFLATVADEVHLYPEGDLDWRGLGAELTFFKKMLDEQNIQVTVLRGRDNKYKSAVEPYLYEKMSDPSREQYSELLGDIWTNMLDEISSARNISVDSLNSMADNLTAMMPAHAYERGMVDGLSYRDQVRDAIRMRLKGEEAAADSTDKDLPLVSLSDYHFVVIEDEERPAFRSDKVAVVFANGAIESGEGDDMTIGSARIAGALRDARTDKSVKAVVLRVNSPGGSALASDVIYRETQLIKEAGKPMIVSMGDLAASGGYYISCSADRIFANPNTITGSIGVFGMIPNVGDFLEDEIGITADWVSTNAHTNIMSLYKPLDDVQYERINEGVSEIYDSFLGIVAEGRGMTTTEVDSIAQGRVWSGEDALDIGLVDELGDLQAAIDYAVQVAELEDYRIKDLPVMIDPLQEFLAGMGAEARADFLKAELGVLYPAYEEAAQVQEMLKWNGVQMRLPYALKIH